MASSTPRATELSPSNPLARAPHPASRPDQPETERLILRAFRDADREAFARINADPRVNYWLGGEIDRAASDANIDQVNAHLAEHGFGLWAAEHKHDGRLIGMIGLKRTPPELPISPAIEAGWHLSPDYWGRGLAAEGARAVLEWGLATLAIDQIVATTAMINLRSQAVMRRAGMTEQPALAFDHPLLAADHPLKRHVVYAMSSDAWARRAFIRSAEAGVLQRGASAPDGLYARPAAAPVRCQARAARSADLT